MTSRKLIPSLFALLFVLIAAPVSAQQSVAGRWVLDVTLDLGAGQAIFVFTVEGNEIKGTYGGTFGEADVTGTIDGNKVEFEFDADQAGHVAFHGELTDEGMEGTCEYGQLGAGSFSGAKEEAPAGD